MTSHKLSCVFTGPTWKRISNLSDRFRVKKIDIITLAIDLLENRLEYLDADYTYYIGNKNSFVALADLREIISDRLAKKKR